MNRRGIILLVLLAMVVLSFSAVHAVIDHHIDFHTVPVFCLL